MNKIKVFGLVGTCIASFSFTTIGIAKDELQQHEVEGKFGDKSVKSGEYLDSPNRRTYKVKKLNKNYEKE
jgi:hypothetical protein